MKSMNQRSSLWAGRSKMMSLLAQSFHLDLSTFAQLDSHQIRGAKHLTWSKMYLDMLSMLFPLPSYHGILGEFRWIPVAPAGCHQAWRKCPGHPWAIEVVGGQKSH